MVQKGRKNLYDGSFAGERMEWKELLPFFFVGVVRRRFLGGVILGSFQGYEPQGGSRCRTSKMKYVIIVVCRENRKPLSVRMTSCSVATVAWGLSD